MRSILFLGITLFFISNVSAQEISIFSGFFGNTYYQDDKKITKSDLISFIEKDEKAYSSWKKSRTQQTIAYTMLATEVGFGIWGISEARRTGEVSTVATIGVLGSATLGIIFALRANNSRKKSVLTYNKGIDKKTTYRLVPTSSQHGIGLALKF